MQQARSDFDLLSEAMEEAAWSAEAFRRPHAIVMNFEGYTVVDKQYLKPEDVILEIFNSKAPPVRGGDYSIEDEGGEASSSSTCTWRVDPYRKKTCGDKL